MVLTHRDHGLSENCSFLCQQNTRATLSEREVQLVGRDSCPDERIQEMSRRSSSSEAWRICIRKNPTILIAKSSASKSIFGSVSSISSSISRTLVYDHHHPSRPPSSGFRLSPFIFQEAPTCGCRSFVLTSGLTQCTCFLLFSFSISSSKTLTLPTAFLRSPCYIELNLNCSQALIFRSFDGFWILCYSAGRAF